MTSPTKIPYGSHSDSWINGMIAIGSGMFVFGLAVSAAFAPEWRVLHLLQAFIYVGVVMLTRRKNPAGFGAGLAVAVFWNVLLLTTAGHDILQELRTLALTGRPQHPDLLLSTFAGCGHLLIIIACILGFGRMRPTARQWATVGIGSVIALTYLLAIVFLFGPPQAVALMKHTFGLQ